MSVYSSKAVRKINKRLYLSVAYVSVRCFGDSD